MTLEEVLGSPQASLKLWKYAKKENNAENIEFLLLVRGINSALGSPGLPLFPPGMNKPADRLKYIYERCIAPTKNLILTSELKEAIVIDKTVGGTRWGRSGTQVNLPAPMYASLETAYSKGILSSTSFNSAYSEILRLAKRDLWKRYIETPEGAQLTAVTLPLKPTVIHLRKK